MESQEKQQEAKDCHADLSSQEPEESSQGFRPSGNLSQIASNSFVALSKFIVANGMTAEVKQAFVDRPHLVDQAAGFLRMEVISPLDNPDEIWLLTYWIDEASYKSWHHSHLYKDSHEGIPKGLKLVQKSAQVRFFEYVCS